MRKITAKFKSKCSQTGWNIKKGDPALYNPKDKTCYHWASPTAEEWQAAEKKKDEEFTANRLQYNSDTDAAHEIEMLDNWARNNL